MGRMRMWRVTTDMIAEAAPRLGLGRFAGAYPTHQGSFRRAASRR